MTCEEVFNQFKNFLYKIAHKWSAQYNIDDLFQVASIGLTKAYNAYDVDKNIFFMTYLGTITENEIKMFHRKMKKHANVGSLDDITYIGKDGDSISLLEMVADEINYEDLAIENIASNELMILTNNLSEREKTIINYIFIDRMKQPQIAKKLDVSQSYVSRIVTKTLKKLKSEYEKGGIYLNTKDNHRNDCFKYFSENDNQPKEKLIKYIIDHWGYAPITAENYYRVWKRAYLQENHNVNNPGNEATITKESMENETVNKPDIKSEEKKVEGLITTSKVEHKKVEFTLGGILQPTELKGRIMNYKMLDNGISMRRPNGNTVMPISFNEIDIIICELQEIKKVFSRE